MRHRHVRFALFILIGIAMLAIAGHKIVLAEYTLRHGAPYRVRLTGFDPQDPFRGHYLLFRMPDRAERADSGWAGRPGDRGFVTLSRSGDGFAVFAELRAAPPAAGDYLRVDRRYMSQEFTPPFDRYFVNERQARFAEDAMREAQTAGRCFLDFRVYNGFAAIEDIVIGDTPLRQLLKADAGK
jgi:uncharacterized membrane-anchored protein